MDFAKKRAQNVPFLQESLTKFLQEGEFVCYSKGQTLFYAGHIPFGFFLLKKGKVSFQSLDRSKDGVDPCENGKLLGLSHLIEQTPYCKTCRAEEQTETLFFSKPTLMNFFQSLQERKQKG